MMPLCTMADLPLAVAVGMGVLLGRAAMGGPAGMGDAVMPGQRPGDPLFFQVGNLARGADDRASFLPSATTSPAES